MTQNATTPHDGATTHARPTRRGLMGGLALAAVATPALAAGAQPLLTGWDRIIAGAEMYGDQQITAFLRACRQAGWTPDQTGAFMQADIDLRDRWSGVQALHKPGHADWADTIRWADRGGFEPEHVEGVYECLHGAERGRLTLTVIRPETGEICFYGREGRRV